MVKSTVRFPESIVEEIEVLVGEGTFESKSEFHRFASEYLLTQISEEYEPQTIDFEEMRGEILGTEQDPIERVEPTPSADEGLLRAAAVIRRYGMRGEFDDAEAFIDQHYQPAEPTAVVLEELLELHRRRGDPGE